LRLAESLRRHGRRRDVFFCEVIADGSGSLFRKPLVHGITAHAIGVAFNGESKVRVGKNDSGYFSELLARDRTKRGLAGVKQNVRQAHDETTGSIASGKNDVELLQQFGAQFFAIPHCLRELLI
jgi:hypothetical protein